MLRGNPSGAGCAGVSFATSSLDSSLPAPSCPCGVRRSNIVYIHFRAMSHSTANELANERTLGLSRALSSPANSLSLSRFRPAYVSSEEAIAHRIAPPTLRLQPEMPFFATMIGEQVEMGERIMRVEEAGAEGAEP